MLLFIYLAYRIFIPWPQQDSLRISQNETINIPTNQSLQLRNLHHIGPVALQRCWSYHTIPHLQHLGVGLRLINLDEAIKTEHFPLLSQRRVRDIHQPLRWFRLLVVRMLRRNKLKWIMTRARKDTQHVALLHEPPAGRCLGSRSTACCRPYLCVHSPTYF